MGKVIVIAAVLAGAQALQAADSMGGFIRGDSNLDGEVDIGDAVSTISFLFIGGACDCLDAADFDASGELDITDPIGLLGYLFLGGPGPKPPFPTCGAAGGGGGSLGCESPTCSLEEIAWLYQGDHCRQCEPCFPAIEDIVADLERWGVAVLDSKRAWNPDIGAVCLACSCPSGMAYFVLVAGDDVEVLLGMGWTRGEAP